MHVLFLTKWYPGRNDPQLGVFIQEQARAVSRFATVSVIFAHPVKSQTQKLLVDRVLNNQILELRAYYRANENSNAFMRKLSNLLSYRQATRAALKELLSERGYPDINHVHILVRPSLLALGLWISKGIPFIISEQSSEYLDGTWARKSIPFKLFNRWVIRRASSVTAVSSWLSQGMRDLGLSGKYRIVPNVLPLDRTPIAPQGRNGHFLMVADLVDKTKNVSAVIRAVKTLQPEIPQIRLDIIGDGVDRDSLVELSSSLGLKEVVTFLGRLPNMEVMTHMRNVGCVVINSRVETFSVVTGEALMLGKPVIATRCGGPAAFVNDKNGILIPVGDQRALERAIRSMCEKGDQFNPQVIRDSIGNSSSPEAVGQAFMNIYREVIG
jgi:glycosyltransferase involved in cell wall biosynthesis